MDSIAPHALPGTDVDVGGIFWSADSTEIGFYASGGKELRSVSIKGGTPRVIATGLETRFLGATRAGYWSTDNTIVFAQPDGLYRLPAAGGAPPVKIAEAGAMPNPLPGGRWLYLLPKKKAAATLLVEGAGLATPVTLQVESNAVFTSGYLVYRQRQSLVARPFDPVAVAFTGPPVLLVDDVKFNPGNGRTAFDATADLLAYYPEPPRKLVWKDRQGVSIGFVGEVSHDWNPVVARDGSIRIAIDRTDVTQDTMHVWTIDSQGTEAQITNGVRERFPVWSPDGQWIAYVSVGSEGSQIHRTRSARRTDDEALVGGAGRHMPLDYTNDYFLYGTETDDLFALPLRDGNPVPGAKPLQVTNTPKAVETTARLSPDGRWIAITQDEGGERNIWVQEFPNAKSRRRVSPGGGEDASWRQDGRELYYVTATGVLMAVPIPIPGTFGAPVKLFTFNARLGIPLHSYSPAPDGQRFLVAETIGGPEVITVVANWRSLLR